MPSQVRTGDMTVGICSHGLPCCVHGCVGIHVTGSSDTIVNSQLAVRAPGDISVHTCPHCGVNITVCGSGDININNLMAHRVGDCETECCGVGVSVTGSPNVIDNG